MTQQTINIGTAPNDGTGDPLRTAFTKSNANFTELYGLSGHGLPVGGSSGQVLTKTSGTDYAANWQTPSTVTPRNKARLQAQWVSGAVVQDSTVYLAYDAPYTGTIEGLTYFTGSGSFTVAIQINGVPVTGLSAVAVSSATPATVTASGAKTFTAGQRITAVISGAAGSPANALLSLDVTWS